MTIPEAHDTVSASPYRDGGLRLALFDLDGTITRQNVFLAFIEYAVGPKDFRRGLLRLGPYIGLHYCGLIAAKRIKELFIEYYFGGWPIEDLRAHAHDFTRVHMDRLTRPRAVQRICWHQQLGHHVVVVSACVRTWFEEWCDERNLEVVATELAVHGGTVTGRLATENCHGPEKVRRLRARFDLRRFDYIYAYGDSAGDREMLAIADQSFYRPFQ